MASKKKANIEGTLDGDVQPTEAPKTRAANRITIELSPAVVNILKQGAAELSVKMPDLLRRLAESPLIEKAADALLEGIAAQALQKLQKWIPSAPPGTPPSYPHPMDSDSRDLDGDLDRRDAV